MKSWIPHLIGALAAEIEVVRRQGRGITLSVKDGLPRDPASVGAAGVSVIWFKTDYDGLLPDDAAGQLRLANRSFQATLLGLEPGRVLIAIEHPQGPLPDLSAGSLQLDPSELLETLKMRLTEAAQGGTQVNWALLNQVSGDQGARVGRVEAAKCVIGGLTDEQVEAVRLALGSSVLFLQGPPGTGKTHTISHMVASALAAGRSILVTSHTHVAVDQALLALIRNHEGSPELRGKRILRVGEPRLEGIPERYLLEHIERDRLAQASSIAGANAIFATLSKVYMDQSLWGQTFNVVLIDEVSMVNPALAFAGLSRAKDAAVLVGDPHQLPPIVQSFNPLAQAWLGRDLFDRAGATERDCFSRLTLQRRMRPEIADIARRLRYRREGELVDSPITSTRPRPSLRAEPLGFDPVVRIDVKLPKGSTLPDAGTSYWNLSSGLASVEILRQLAGQLPRPESLDRRPLGLIVPFAAQRRLVLQLIQAAGFFEWVLPGTVHTFQGNESDVVLFDPVFTTPVSSKRLTRPADFAETSRDINVAVTRAKDQLALVGKMGWLAAQPAASALGVLGEATGRASQRQWAADGSTNEWQIHDSPVAFAARADLPASRFVFVSGDKVFLDLLGERIRLWSGSGRPVLVASGPRAWDNHPDEAIRVPWADLPQRMVVTDRTVSASVDGDTWITVSGTGAADVVSRLLRLPGLAQHFGEKNGQCAACHGVTSVVMRDSGSDRYHVSCPQGHSSSVPAVGWPRLSRPAPREAAGEQALSRDDSGRPATAPGRPAVPPATPSPSPAQPNPEPKSSRQAEPRCAACGHPRRFHPEQGPCSLARCHCRNWVPK